MTITKPLIALTFSEKGKFNYTSAYVADKEKYIASARLVFTIQEKITSRTSPFRTDLNRSSNEQDNDKTSLLKAARSISTEQDDQYPGVVRIHIQGLSNGFCGCGASRAEGLLEVQLKNRPGVESPSGGTTIRGDLIQNAKGNSVLAVDGGKVNIVYYDGLNSRDLEIQRKEFKGGVYCGFDLGAYDLFRLDTPSIKRREMLEGIERKIVDFLKEDGYSPNFENFTNVFADIARFYHHKASLHHKIVGINLGVFVQRYIMLFKNSQKDSNPSYSKYKNIAFSALSIIDDSIIPDKQMFFKELMEANDVNNIPDFLRFLDSSKYFLMFKPSESRE